MPYFIKTGFWDKLAKAPKGYLNLSDLIVPQNLSSLGFPAIQRDIVVIDDVTLAAIRISSDTTVYSSSLSFSNLTTVTGDVNLYASQNTAVNFPKLQSANSISISGALSVSLPKLVSCVEDVFINSPYITNIDLPEYVSGGIFFDYMDSVSSINLPKYTTTGPNERINIIPSPDTITPLTTLTFPSLLTAGSVSINSFSNLTDISFPVATSLITSPGDGIYLNNNALSESCVNALLAKFVETNVSNETIDLSGGTNAAPTGQGILDVATLTANGCTVLTN